MINNNLKQRATLLFFATLLVSNAAVANVAFQNPNTASWGGWTRGDANTSFVHWDKIGGPGTLDLVDTTPDAGNIGTTTAVLAPNNAGAFVTGGGAGGNIYSFSDTPDFSVVLQPDYATPTAPVTVALQLKVLGTDLDLSSVKLDGATWDSTQTIFSGTAGGPFGGLDKEYLFVWDNVAASIAYSLNFLATGSSMSLDEVSVDIGVSAVPVPAAVWMFMTALSGLAVTSRRKANIA
jgi:hypothetical protein